jgi:hypothetical protein
VGGRKVSSRSEFVDRRRQRPSWALAAAFSKGRSASSKDRSASSKDRSDSSHSIAAKTVSLEQVQRAGLNDAGLWRIAAPS